MLTATLGRPGAPLSILCLGAHSDDIEIGCAGTILRLLADHPGSSVRWVVFSSDAAREAEARASANDLLAGAGRAEVDVHQFRESFFPHDGGAIKEQFETLKGTVAPDLILAHRTKDDHQDHRTIGELTWNTFRDHLIVEYEIPKYEGDLGHPSLFVPLSETVARRKIAALIQHFPSQVRRRWFRAENFEALMRLRGLECNAAEGFAEAFYLRKLTI